MLVYSHVFHFYKERMKTYSPKAGEIKRNWVVVDASGAPLGRLASRISMILRGKHKPTFTPHMDTGDFVVVVNAKNAKRNKPFLIAETM